jgi:PAS domain-containing protein
MGRARRNLPKVFSIGADFSTRLLEAIPDAVMAVSADGKVLQWNHAAEIMFGFRRDEGVGHLLNNLMVPSDRVEEEHQIQNDALASGLAVYESVRRRKDGFASARQRFHQGKALLPEFAAILDETREE